MDIQKLLHKCTIIYIMLNRFFRDANDNFLHYYKDMI